MLYALKFLFFSEIFTVALVTDNVAPTFFAIFFMSAERQLLHARQLLEICGLCMLLYLFFGAEDEKKNQEVLALRENYWTSIYCVIFWR